MRLPEGVQGTVVVLLGLGVEVHLHGLGDVLLVDGVHRQSDGLAGDGSFIQRQEEHDAFRGAFGGAFGGACQTSAAC